MSKLEEVYVVWGEQGTYSDHSIWMVCWFQTQSVAEVYADRLNELVELLNKMADEEMCGSGSPDPRNSQEMKSFRAMDPVVGDDVDIYVLYPSYPARYRVKKLPRGHLPPLTETLRR